MEKVKLNYARDILASVENEKLADPVAAMYKSGRTILRHGPDVYQRKIEKNSII